MKSGSIVNKSVVYPCISFWSARYEMECDYCTGFSSCFSFNTAEVTKKALQKFYNLQIGLLTKLRVVFGTERWKMFQKRFLMH